MACDDCKTMPPRYPHTLTVEMPGTIRDAAGQVDLTDDANWTTAGRIKGRFITKGGSEWYSFKQTQATTTAFIETPWTTISRSIEPSWRLKMGGRVFDITAAYRVDEVGKIVRIEVTEVR